jgi:anti-sigma factor RsiW
MKCPSEGVLRAYIDQELEVSQRQEFESHLESCAGCREQAAALADAAKRVEAQLLLLEPKLLGGEKTPEAALADFKAQLDTEKPSLVDWIFSKRWRPVWVVTAVAAVLLISLAFPSGRGLAQRLLSTLRVERVQTVNLDFSSLEGNRGLQERVAKMLSEKVAIIADEKPQHADTAQAASQLAGFEVKVLGGREDAPEFHIEGAQALQMTLAGYFGPVGTLRSESSGDDGWSDGLGAGAALCRIDVWKLQEA